MGTTNGHHHPPQRLERRAGELPEDWEERRRLHQMATLPPEKKAARLQRERSRDEAGASTGTHIDRTRTALESASGEDWAHVHVLADPERTRPDLLAIAAESGPAAPVERELPLAADTRRAALRLWLDWAFDRGHWAEPGDITARVFAFAWAAFPDLLAHYCDASVRLLTAPAGNQRARRLRRRLFTRAACKRSGWDFKTARPRRGQAPDIALICAMGLGPILPVLDTVRPLVDLWFRGTPARYSAEPALVTRRALATAFALDPALVRGMTMEELAESTGQVKQTFQWMVDGLFKSKGVMPATCRPPGNYAEGQKRAREKASH